MGRARQALAADLPYDASSGVAFAWSSLFGAQGFSVAIAKRLKQNVGCKTKGSKDDEEQRAGTRVWMLEREEGGPWRGGLALRLRDKKLTGGAVRDTLDEMDLLERTGIVVTADHGEALGEHDQLRTIHLQPSYPRVEGREELYDIKKDPLARNDLSKEMPDVLKVFDRDLKRRRAERQDLAAGNAEINEETVEVLKALGYVR